MREVKQTDDVLNRTHSKRGADDILTMAEIHRLESYWNKYGKQLPSVFDTLHGQLINVTLVTRDTEKDTEKRGS